MSKRLWSCIVMGAGSLVCLFPSSGAGVIEVSPFADHRRSMAARSDADQPASAAAPLIETVQADPVDCGLLKIGQDAVRTVRIRNAGENAIRLKVVRVSCKCLVYTVTPTELPPGSDAEVRMTVAVTGGTGRQEQVMELEAVEEPAPAGRERRRQTLGMPISFTPDRDYVVNPPEVFLRVVAGQPVQFEIYIARKSRGDLVVDEAEATVRGFKVQGPRTLETNPAVQVLTVSGVFEETGLHEGGVRFRSNSGSAPIAEVPVAVRVLTRWYFEPAGAVFTYQMGEAAPLVSRLVLRPRASDVPAPARCVRDRIPPGVTVSDPHPVEGGKAFEVSVELSPTLLETPTDHLTVRITDSLGRHAADLPIVWYQRTDRPNP